MMKADILTQLVLPLALFIIMLGMGLSLKVSDFTRILKQPKAVLIGISCQMILLPLIGCLMVFLLPLGGELAVGLMILAFCPGGTTSNMFSYLGRGDVALSISLTAVVSLITPFTIPLLTILAMSLLLNDAQHFTIPLGKTIIQLIAITVIPVAIGMFIHRHAPVFSARAERPVKILSIAFLFIIIAGVVAKNWSSMAGFFLQTGAASLSLNLVSLIAGFLIAGLANLSRAQSIAIAVEVGIQNGTLALLVSGTLLGSSIMTIPAVTYSLLMFVTGCVFCWWVNRKVEVR